MKILLTGASGYLGSLLVDSWLNNPEVEKIITIDLKDPQFIFTKDHPKIHFIQGNLADLNLDEILEDFFPIDVVAHAAYLIRTPFFKKDLNYQERSNFLGAENVFKFTFRNQIPTLIHFSSVAIYGARPENQLDEPFQESSPLREDQIAYGRDKKNIETKLEEIFKKYHPETNVFILRIHPISS